MSLGFVLLAMLILELSCTPGVISDQVHPTYFCNNNLRLRIWNSFSYLKVEYHYSQKQHWQSLKTKTHNTTDLYLSWLFHSNINAAIVGGSVQWCTIVNYEDLHRSGNFESKSSLLLNIAWLIIFLHRKVGEETTQTNTCHLIGWPLRFILLSSISSSWKWQRPHCVCVGLCLSISRKRHLTELSLSGILSGSPGQVKAKPIVQAKRIQLLSIQHPLFALGHPKEPLLVDNVNCILEYFVPLLCKAHSMSCWGARQSWCACVLLEITCLQSIKGKGSKSLQKRVMLIVAQKCLELVRKSGHPRELVPPLMRNPTVVSTSPFSSPWLQVQIWELVLLRVTMAPLVSTITTGRLVWNPMAESFAQQAASAWWIAILISDLCPPEGSLSWKACWVSQDKWIPNGVCNS